MPEYNFKCEKCSHSFSEFWSVSKYDEEKSKCKCPKCRSKKVFRSYEEDNVFASVKEIKTIGQLAEANAKKMGKYKLEEKTQEDSIKIPKKQKEKRDLFRKINKMTPKQKQRWIHEGD